MHSDTQEHTQVDPKIIPAAQFSSLYPPLRLPKSKAKEINTQDFPPAFPLLYPLIQWGGYPNPAEIPRTRASKRPPQKG